MLSVIQFNLNAVLISHNPTLPTPTPTSTHHPSYTGIPTPVPRSILRPSHGPSSRPPRVGSSVTHLAEAPWLPGAPIRMLTETPASTVGTALRGKAK
ncbi:MAG: hypothetical protein QOH84_3538 [Kribbellaceae bacterium]|nr:hypothetical protein [Kribbellaceae bacterium]